MRQVKSFIFVPISTEISLACFLHRSAGKVLTPGQAPDVLFKISGFWFSFSQGEILDTYLEENLACFQRCWCWRQAPRQAPPASNGGAQKPPRRLPPQPGSALAYKSRASARAPSSARLRPPAQAPAAERHEAGTENLFLATNLAQFLAPDLAVILCPSSEFLCF